MDNCVHLLKLSVGTESVDGLDAWQRSRRARGVDGLPRHVTRMWPRREAEILNGGSIYWVIKGVILARQKIVRLDEVRGEDGIRRCAIILETELHRTVSVPRRPFQGWRYLSPADAPPDLGRGQSQNETVPHELMTALADIGVR